VNVRTKDKDQRWNEQLTPGNAKEGTGRADAQADGDTGNNLPTEFGRNERGQPRRQEPFADQEQTNRHEQNGNFFRSRR
jgi:hypothetical protein